jgi:hypothetical protein
VTYRGSHTAPTSEGAPLYDLAFNSVYPPDVYEHPEWYAPSHSSDAEAWSIIRRSYYKPDRFVTIYRAVPKGVRFIHPGDWVAITKSYARDHARSNDPSELDMLVVSARVRARQIYTGGDSYQEWGYVGEQPVRATVVFRPRKPLTEDQKIERLQARQRKRSIERAKEWRF